MNKTFNENKIDFLKSVLHPVLHVPIADLNIVKSIEDKNGVVELSIINTLSENKFIGEYNFLEYVLEEALKYYFNVDDENFKIIYIKEKFDYSQYTEQNLEKLKSVSALKKVEDPELNISVYDLGLIYDVEHKNNEINVTMTLTTPDCPEAEILPELVQNEIKNQFPDKTVNINLTFEPAWNIDSMPFNTKLTNNLF